MLQRLRQAKLIWPTVLTVAGLAVLGSLGTWQLARKQWKEGLIAKISARVGADPIPLSKVEQIWQSDGDVEYLHASARGRFHHDKERYLYAPGKRELGWHVYTPLEIAPNRFVWVNRGFVPEKTKAPERRLQGQLQGEVAVTGLIRSHIRQGFFTPDNDAERNVWYWPDTAAMSRSAFLGTSVDTLPLVLDADAQPEPPGGLPKGGVTRLTLPNRHLEYALTWYGLGAALIAVYFAFAAGRLRSVAPAR